ncbi:hypothetical protein [Myxococcus landrumensis]|uniref:Uncharacterized protein n=1 Tax=Myxococcus landrumensis TaxID=2813577 RepID=A0ABX7NAN6_9BACT|nr:hypothetical protein [Myxococcus landrumus]QSQ14692.1 hypothetical protein JY572_00945 [Myxococcus landrumus]
MRFFAYPYAGPEEIRRHCIAAPPGALIRALPDLHAWLASHPDALIEGSTYVVDLRACLRLSPRRSEHVACAGGEDVLAAGEMGFFAHARGASVTAVSNLSTGYRPDVSCWDAVAESLARAGLSAPPGFTTSVHFRRCPACGESTLVKEQWFVCTFCDADLPLEWNVSARREVDVVAHVDRVRSLSTP